MRASWRALVVVPLLAAAAASPALAAAMPRPPRIAVTKRSPAVAPGFVFTAPKTPQGATKANPRQGAVIVDNRGRVRWFRPAKPHDWITDFRVQTYRGRPVLTFWEGRSSNGHGRGTDVILDSHYHVIKRVQAGRGCHADMHEFRLTPEGTALITCYKPTHRDLRPIGGHRHTRVVDSIVQVVGIASGRVLFDWSALDHLPISDSYEPVKRLYGGKTYDPFHVNSIDEDADGNLLVSFRHAWTVVKIDRSSGRIIWRLGGKHSDFKLGPGVRTAWQHDAQWAGPDLVRIFDNGAATGIGRVHVHPRSRVITVALDEQHMTARLIKRLVHPGKLSAVSQGNGQLPANGDTFVGWGATGWLSELDPSGRLLFDAHVPKGYDTYRAYRFPWTGTPSAPPALSVHAGVASASWNGSTGVRRWQLLAGPGRHRLHTLGAPVRWHGLYTRIPLGRHPHRWLAVRALDRSGATLATSKPVRAK